MEENIAPETEEYVRLVVERSRPLPISLADIERATKEDDCLQSAIMAVQSGGWKDIMANNKKRTEGAQITLQYLYHV